MRPVLAAASILSLALAAPAFAQQPPPAPPPAAAAPLDPALPPGAYPAPPPGAYAQPVPYGYPPGYAPYPYPYPYPAPLSKKEQKRLERDRDLAYPGEPRVLKNPGLLYGGIALGSLGVVGLFSGLMFVLIGGTDCAVGSCSDGAGRVDGGFALMIGGLVLVGAGVPMIVIGAKRAPKHEVEGLATSPKITPLVTAKGIGFAF